MSNYPLFSKNYELLHLVGSGTYSRVYEANCRDNNKVIAIKQINLDEFPLELETIQRQTAFWSKCDHPNVVKYYGSFVDGSTLWILNEYMGAGSLKDIIKFGYPNGFKDESLIAALLAQVITGVKFFHDNHEIHRDIRSNNILVNSEGFVKLGDFGLATSLVKGGTRQGSTLSLFGEECYMAPEVLRNENGYSEKTDIWSLGLTAIELGTGKMPYAGMKFMESLVQIIDHDPPSLPDSKEFSSAYKDFVKQCLISDPAKRATAGELLNHRFLRPYTGSGLSSANLLSNAESSLSAAAAAIKKKLSSQLPPLHTIFEKLHKDIDPQRPITSNKSASQLVFDFSSVDGTEKDKDKVDNTEKEKKKKKKEEHKHHRKHGHKKHRHHKEKRPEESGSDEEGNEKKKSSRRRKSKPKSSDSDYDEKEEESVNSESDSESYSDSGAKEDKKKAKQSKKKKESKAESASDSDDDVAYDNESSSYSDEYDEKSKRKERKSKKKKSKKKQRKSKEETTNEDISNSPKEEKKDVQKMGRFCVTRTESNTSLQNSNQKIATGIPLNQSSQNSSFQAQSSSQNLDQQQRIEVLANEITILTGELARLEKENVTLRKRLDDVVDIVTKLQNSE